MAKHAGGRPRKYTDEVLDNLALSLRAWVKDCHKQNKFKLLLEWCFDNDFSPFYFGRYAEQHEEFREAYQWAKSYQELQVAKGGLNKTFDPRFAQFFLGCQHGWRSKDDVEAQKRALRNDFSKFIDHIKGEEEREYDDGDDE